QLAAALVLIDADQSAVPNREEWIQAIRGKLSLSTLSGIGSSTLFGILFEYRRTGGSVGRGTKTGDGAVPAAPTSH
ncbi:MAG: hypothetical protein SGJ19_21980, partial [Planctomycetia bacterium]|nr:hypothetical protein [Planctomycetia bacterium]